MATQVQITSPKCGPVVYFSPREGSGLNTSPSWSTDWWQLSSDNAQYSGAVIFGPRISEWLMAQSCSTDLGHPHWDCKLGENLTCSLNHNIVGSFTLNNISLNTQRSICFLVQWEWSLSPDLKKKKVKLQGYPLLKHQSSIKSTLLRLFSHKCSSQFFHCLRSVVSFPWELVTSGNASLWPPLFLGLQPYSLLPIARWSSIPVAALHWKPLLLGSALLQQFHKFHFANVWKTKTKNINNVSPITFFFKVSIDCDLISWGKLMALILNWNAKSQQRDQRIEQKIKLSRSGIFPTLWRDLFGTGTSVSYRDWDTQEKYFKKPECLNILN